MSPRKLKNVSLKEFRKFLEHQGLNKISTSGGHEKWSKASLARPVTLQSHIDPIPEFIIKNPLRNIGCDYKDFEAWLKE